MENVIKFILFFVVFWVVYRRLVKKPIFPWKIGSGSRYSRPKFKIPDITGGIIIVFVIFFILYAFISRGLSTIDNAVSVKRSAITEIKKPKPPSVVPVTLSPNTNPVEIEIDGNGWECDGHGKSYEVSTDGSDWVSLPKERYHDFPRKVEKVRLMLPEGATETITVDVTIYDGPKP
ncbi:MAG: hypothetical protein H6791_01445 [Candidatus Nomurabacteria bacterium]|nr:MAG: hypothetical protein H6791_01445 [Candidatus Nomurabacteria bacterium]